MVSVFIRFGWINDAKIYFHLKLKGVMACLSHLLREKFSHTSCCSNMEWQEGSKAGVCGGGPFFLPSLGGSNFVAMSPSLFRGSNAAFLGGLHFPWLKESTFCLNYWGFHLLWNMHHSCLAQQRISLPGKRKLEPETVKGLRSSALLKYACQNNIHFQGNKFKHLGPHTIQNWRFFQSLSC